MTATFRLVTLSPELQVTDAKGETLMQVKQKLLTLREDTTVFADAEKTRPLYRMKADRVMGFRAVHRITRLRDEQVIGAVRAVGLRSLWSARYDVTDAQDREVLTIREENPWIKVIDGLIDEIPVIGWIAGMFINPSYLMLNTAGETVFRIRKRRSLVERRFILEPVTPPDPALDPDLVVLALIETVLLERERG
ncbi:hypothetical protein [Deinococcus peraridilitoris]|uniref:hypothetical protein n=1 Tax=Deinococcus peraridilitoris TaxID=432329 RepID=UPI0002DC5F6F|nr:hypothetical protein [Deinococcus peraridilitoris]